MRIGAVSYLNTKPLVYGLDAAHADYDLVFDLPSRLADDLSAGKLDVALIPSIEFFRNPEYTIVSDACIGCRGPVLSVKLLSRVPMHKIRTLALDEGSRTSVALVRILLQQRLGLTPELHPFPIGSSLEDITTDAALLIGDRAMHLPATGFVEQWDLGDHWCRWSELPFVFAMWVARSSLTVGRLSDVLAIARDAGVNHLDEIARVEAPLVGLTERECREYFVDNLHFYLGERERQGLEMFYQHAVELDLAPAGREIRFDDCTTS